MATVNVQPLGEITGLSLAADEIAQRGAVFFHMRQTGPAEIAQRKRDRHIADSAQLFQLVPEPKTWIDLGSGGVFAVRPCSREGQEEVFLGVLVGLPIAKAIILRHLKVVSQRTASALDDLFHELLRRIVGQLVYLSSALYCAALFLTLPDNFGRLLQSLAHGYPGVFQPGLDMNLTFSNIEGPCHSVTPEQLHCAGHRLNPTKQ